MKLLHEYIRLILLESNKAAEIRDYYGIDLWMKGPYGGDQYEPDIVEIESLVVPEEKRGQGIATDVMFELVRWADSNGYILALDPSSDFGSSVSRLRKFYSQFGFSGNKGRKKDYRTRYAMIRYPKNKVLKEEARQPSFKYKGSSNYFRVELPNIGYAEGGLNLRFPDCQSDVDALMETPEYLAAEKKYVANAKPRTDIVKNEETGQYEEVEIGQAIFRPKFYDVNNAWINNPENRGKGYGKQIYKAFINKAVEYSRPSGGVFIGAHHCTIGSGTSPEAKRVWASLAREYSSSGDVIFIGL